jgi:tRNA-dihydrouridine synthase A
MHNHLIGPERSHTKIISVAPMMDYTDRHYRYFVRILAPDILLYTEMITAQALMHADIHYLLSYNEEEHPIALQLGGSDPVIMAKAAKLGEKYGYDEINLNVGCPSPRVSKGRFGACLMLEPELVAQCVSAMQDNVSVPVTVKTRIGVDNQDDYTSLQDFIGIISRAGCKTFIIHARKAWLSGLSPKQNRDVPPLRYDIVYQLKKDFPELTIILNGGIKTMEDIYRCLPHIDGVMIGREAYSNPYFLANIQASYFPNTFVDNRETVIQKFIPYVSAQLKKGIKLQTMTKPILGLFQGRRGAGKWRRYLSEHACKTNAGVEVIEQALFSTQV